MNFQSVDWFRRTLIVAVFLILPPWRWPHKWPKHVGGYHIINLHSYTQVRLLLFFLNILFSVLNLFLGVFAKLRKVTVSFFMSLCLSLYLSLCLPVCQSVRPFVRPPARMEQVGSHWTDFREIWYLIIFRTSVNKIRVWLKYGKNNGYFTWRHMYIYNNIFLNYSWNEKCFGHKLRKNQNIHFIFHNFCFQKA